MPKQGARGIFFLTPSVSALFFSRPKDGRRICWKEQQTFFNAATSAWSRRNQAATSSNSVKKRENFMKEPKCCRFFDWIKRFLLLLLLLSLLRNQHGRNGPLFSYSPEAIIKKHAQRQQQNWHRQNQIKKEVDVDTLGFGEMLGMDGVSYIHRRTPRNEGPKLIYRNIRKRVKSTSDRVGNRKRKREPEKHDPPS